MTFTFIISLIVILFYKYILSKIYFKFINYGTEITF